MEKTITPLNFSFHSYLFLEYSPLKQFAYYLKPIVLFARIPFFNFFFCQLTAYYIIIYCIITTVVLLIVNISITSHNYHFFFVVKTFGILANFKSSVQFNRSVMSDSLRPHESQHARPPCPSLTPRVYSNSCPSSQWCRPAISSSVVPFSSCLQSLPASVFSNESTSHEVAKVLEFQFSISPSSEHPGLISFRMDWLDLLAVQGTLKSLFQHHSSKASILLCSAFLIVPTLISIHDHRKNHSLD